MTQPLFTERFALGFAFCSWLDNRPPTACSRAELPWLSPTVMAQQGNVPAVLSVMPATATGSPSLLQGQGWSWSGAPQKQVCQPVLRHCGRTPSPMLWIHPV